MPPMSRMVRNWSSVRLRLTPQTARELEWLATKGRVAWATTSSKHSSLRWETSSTMPACSICVSASMPAAVRPAWVSCPLASGPCAFQLSDDMSTPKLLSTSISAGSSAKNVAFSMVWMQATLPSLSAGRMSAALRTLTMRSWLSIAWPLICAMICAWKRAAWAVGISSGTNVAKHCAHGVLPIFASEMAQALPSMRSKSCGCVSSPGK